MLQLLAQRSGDIVVLRCTGRMVAGEGLKALHRTATAQRTTNLVVDLAGVAAIDAAGLGTLLRIRQWCDAQEITLKLVNAGRRVREVLAVTALDSVLHVRPAQSGDDIHRVHRDWACAES